MLVLVELQGLLTGELAAHRYPSTWSALAGTRLSSMIWTAVSACACDSSSGGEQSQRVATGAEDEQAAR